MEEGRLALDTLEDDPQAEDIVREGPFEVDSVEDGPPALDYVEESKGLCGAG